MGSVIRTSQTPLVDCFHVTQSYIKIEGIKDNEEASHLVSKKWRKVAKNLRNIFPQSIRN